MPKKYGSLRERFDAKVTITDHCWEWQAAKNNMGYGVIGVTNVGQRLAHRISYELHTGEIPNGLCVLHRCDNPGCVRPDHLFLGTKKDNVADMDAKGRRVSNPNPNNKPPRHSGDSHPRAKLTSELVENLRHRHAKGEALCSLARQYGVDKAVMRNALRGKTWPNAKGPLASPQRNKFETYIGSVHANSKLTENLVIEARKRYAAGESTPTLAKVYGVSVSVISDAIARRSWKHVT